MYLYAQPVKKKAKVQLDEKLTLSFKWFAMFLEWTVRFNKTQSVSYAFMTFVLNFFYLILHLWSIKGIFLNVLEILIKMYTMTNLIKVVEIFTFFKGKYLKMEGKALYVLEFYH